MTARALILTDIHLESPDCPADIYLDIFEKYPCHEIILGGDIYDKSEAIGDKQWSVVEYLRKHKEGVAYVDGNHDPASDGVVNGMIGVKTRKEYRWKIGEKTFCVLHGHQFDRLGIFFSEPLVDKIITKIFTFLQKLDRHNRHVGKWLDYFHQRLALHIARRAIRYAKKHGVDVIICGHINRLDQLVVVDRKGKKTEYANCGGWDEKVVTFITVTESGEVVLHCIPRK